ncbi:MAG TPA: glycoside hydrolase family 19 protein [Polyangiaceae bacterium]|nr:glycoside hydrolase family 19 protein [Polyangiaceae bacterium]
MKLTFSSLFAVSCLALVGCATLEDGGLDGDGTWGTGGTSTVPGAGGATGGGMATGGTATGGSLVGVGGTLVGSGGTGGTTSVDTCNYPIWSASESYAVGAIVTYPSTTDQYVVVNATSPGIDPTISTWYWQPYECTSAGTGGTTSSTGGAAGTGGSNNGSAFSQLLPESVFNQMFPAQNRDPLFTYAGLVAAVEDYPGFATTGDTTTRKREIAAFLANVAQETGFLKYTREINQGEYCEWRADCACQAGQKYFGRGAIQLSWNYNYCAASAALSHLGLGDLRANPDLVATSAELAWVTGVWYWMERDGGSGTTSHQAIINGSFGGTIRAINGSLECGAKWYSAAGPARVSNFENFCSLMGISPGGNLTC